MRRLAGRYGRQHTACARRAGSGSDKRGDQMDKKKDGVQSPIATPLKPHHILYYATGIIVLDGGAIARMPVARCRKTLCGKP